VRAGQRLADAGELRIKPVFEVTLGLRLNNHLFKVILEYAVHNPSPVWKTWPMRPVLTQSQRLSTDTATSHVRSGMRIRRGI
jgi:hypothetical protein